MLRLGTNYAECAWSGCSSCLRRLPQLFARAFRLDRFGGSAKVPLNVSLFLLLRLLAENVLVLCVGLREVIQPEALTVLEVAAALGIPLNRQLDPPLNFRRRALTAAAEVLVVLNLELTDVTLELRQFFVDGRHGRNVP